jgi:hypothetical protein
MDFPENINRLAQVTIPEEMNVRELMAVVRYWREYDYRKSLSFQAHTDDLNKKNDALSKESDELHKAFDKEHADHLADVKNLKFELHKVTAAWEAAQQCRLSYLAQIDKLENERVDWYKYRDALVSKLVEQERETVKWQTKAKDANAAYHNLVALTTAQRMEQAFVKPDMTEGLKKDVELMLMLLGDAGRYKSGNCSSPWCNGVHADGGACEGDYQASRCITELYDKYMPNKNSGTVHIEVDPNPWINNPHTATQCLASRRIPGGVQFCVLGPNHPGDHKTK